jgi:hypothetical protein
MDCAYRLGRTQNLPSRAMTTLNEIVVPPPTGNASTDTANALAALNVPTGTTVAFQASSSTVYVIDQELPVPPGVRVTGRGGPSEKAAGLMPTLQQAPGVALKCIMASSGFLAGLYNTPQYNNGSPERYADPAIEIDHLAFDGQNGNANTAGHGVVLYSIQSKVHDCYFVNIPQAGIVVADRNYSGAYCKGQTFENRVADNHIVNPGSYGIWVTYTHSAIGATDGYVIGNRIDSPSLQGSAAGPNINPATKRPYEGIRMDNSAGWWMVNNRLFNCPGNGCFLDTTWGVHLSQNSVSGFGCHPLPHQQYFGFQIITSGTGGRNRNAHHGFINGNVASAYEGLNPEGPKASGTSNAYVYFSVSMQLEPYDISASFEQSNNVASQASQPASPIGPAAVATGSAVVVLPTRSAAALQPGMSVSDSQGLIPSTATIVSIKPGTGSLRDRVTLSAKASGSSTNDVLSFPGPTSTAWSYVNNEPGSTVNVYRTNEVVTGTINATPAISGTAQVNIIDPANTAGGVSISGAAAPGHVLVATSPKTAAWAAPRAWGPMVPATVMTSSATFRVPGGMAPTGKLRITCVGGGGGGGGGGSASTARVSQVGGAGGAAGTTAQQIVEVGTNTSLTVSVGAGGSGGAGGRRGNAKGSNGANGSDTSVSGVGILVRASGGPGGQGGGGRSELPVDGAAYGGQPGSITPDVTAGCGGRAGTYGGAPVAQSAGGGGGGGAASGGLGGSGGGAGSGAAGGTPGAPGGSRSAPGEQGGASSASGGGGGGGGGAANGAPGGQGGSGATGLVIVSIVDWS